MKVESSQRDWGPEVEASQMEQDKLALFPQERIDGEYLVSFSSSSYMM